MLEIWRTAVYDDDLYEGLYKVSNLGKILSLDYNHTGKPVLMNPGTDKNGYLRVFLSKNGEDKMCLVHRLVAETFLPNPEGKPQVNHKIEGDEGKKINMVIFNEDGTVNKEKTSIEWVTAKENNDYGTRNERSGATNKIVQINGKLSKPVLQFTLDGEFIREWPSIAECGRNGFNIGNVCLCCQGKRKSAYGFKWCYA